MINSSLKQDLFEFGGIPPVWVAFVTPTASEYFGFMQISWYPAYSPNDYAITNYTIKFYDANDILVDVVYLGYVLTYNYNTSSIVNGQYYLTITATDSINQTSQEVRSPVFTIENQLLNINLISCPTDKISLFFLFGGLIAMLIFAIVCFAKKDLVFLSVFFSLGGIVLSYPIFICNDVFGYVSFGVTTIMFLLSGFKLIR
jgi:hypothetical protein